MPIPPYGFQDNTPSIPASSGTMESFLQYVAGYALNPPIPTSVQTANYTANGQEFVKVSTAGGAFTVKLPLAPPDKTVNAVQLVTAGGLLTIQAQSNDTIDISGSVTSFQISQRDETVWLQYHNGTSKWSMLSHSGAPNRQAIGVAAALS